MYICMCVCLLRIRSTQRRTIVQRSNIVHGTNKQINKYSKKVSQSKDAGKTNCQIQRSNVL